MADRRTGRRLSRSCVGRSGRAAGKGAARSPHSGFAEGLVSVQDAGAQLAGLFLAPKAGERILDACAAPGGKTAHVLELSDCSVTALESDPQRAPRIEENLSRLALKADVRVCDAADISRWWDGKPFDAVLLDAPCTASGIVRRHPEIVFLVARTILLPSRNSKNAFWKPFGPSSDPAAGSSMPFVRYSLKKVRSRSRLFLKRTMMHKPLHFQSARVRNCA